MWKYLLTFFILISSCTKGPEFTSVIYGVEPEKEVTIIYHYQESSQKIEQGISGPWQRQVELPIGSTAKIKVFNSDSTFHGSVSISMNNTTTVYKNPPDFNGIFVKEFRVN